MKIEALPSKLVRLADCAKILALTPLGSIWVKLIELPFVLDSPQDFPHKTSASRSSILAEKCLFVDVSCDRIRLVSLELISLPEAVGCTLNLRSMYTGTNHSSRSLSTDAMRQSHVFKFLVLGS
jgi:hypothetical protein